MKSTKWMWTVLLMSLAMWMVATGCKKNVDVFPKSGEVAGWEKTGETRVFVAKDLWQYIDGDAEQYVSAGVVSTSTADYKYQGQMEAVVDIFKMGDAGGAQKVMTAGVTGAQPVQLGDAGMALAQSVVFRKGVYYVRIVAYETMPGGQQALVALARSVEAKLKSR